MKKFLLIIASVALILSTASCNKNRHKIDDEPEVAATNSATPQSNAVQEPKNNLQEKSEDISEPKSAEQVEEISAAAEPATTSALPSNFSVSGTMDGYPMRVNFHFKDGKLSGKYKNVNYGTTMPVNGHYDGYKFYFVGKVAGSTFTFDLTESSYGHYTGYCHTSGGKTKYVDLSIN